MSTQFFGESALTDTRFTDEQEQAPAPGDRVPEAVDQLLELGVTADEPGASRIGWGFGFLMDGTLEVKGWLLVEDCLV